MGQATASLVIDFGALEGQVYLTAELDSDLNQGKTSFSSGDNVYFRVYSDIAYSVATTSGTVVQTDTAVTENITNEVIQFVKVKTASLTKKVTAIVDKTWYGTDLGNLTIATTNSVQAENATDSNFGICTVDYDSEYDVWKITPPAAMPAVWAILIVITAGA